MVLFLSVSDLVDQIARLSVKSNIDRTPLGRKKSFLELQALMPYMRAEFLPVLDEFIKIHYLLESMTYELGQFRILKNKQDTLKKEIDKNFQNTIIEEEKQRWLELISAPTSSKSQAW